MREENRELLLSYSTANPSDRGSHSRLLNFWTERHPQNSGEDVEWTEQKLVGQVNSILRRKCFTELELEELIKRIAVLSSDSPDLVAMFPYLLNHQRIPNLFGNSNRVFIIKY